MLLSQGERGLWKAWSVPERNQEGVVLRVVGIGDRQHFPRPSSPPPSGAGMSLSPYFSGLLYGDGKAERRTCSNDLAAPPLHPASPGNSSEKLQLVYRGGPGRL